MTRSDDFTKGSVEYPSRREPLENSDKRVIASPEDDYEEIDFDLGEQK